jgi:pimeloyl-ACP methyl ester carboxylesterase
MKSVSVNGFDMHYVEHGEGPPVVFVHGSLSDHRAWGKIPVIMGNDHRTLAPDLRYCGIADWPDSGERYSIQTHADDVAAFIRTQTSDSVALVGWSLGGSVSLVMAAQNPGLAGRMFLYEPSLYTFLEGDQLKSVMEGRAAASAGVTPHAQKGDFSNALRAAVDGLNGKAGFFDALSPTIQSMFFDNVRTMPLTAKMPPAPRITAADLGTIDIPVEICFGSDTRSYFQTIALTAAELMPRAKARSIRDAVHLWPSLEPDGFSTLLHEFLAGGQE